MVKYNTGTIAKKFLILSILAYTSMQNCRYIGKVRVHSLKYMAQRYMT